MLSSAVTHLGLPLLLFDLLMTFAMQPEIPFLPVVSSMKRLMRYSLGSVAVGSLLVSFIEPIRFILGAIRRRLKTSNSTPESWPGKMAFHTSQGCLRGVSWIMKSVNRNAYIMVSKLHFLIP